MVLILRTRAEVRHTAGRNLSANAFGAATIPDSILRSLKVNLPIVGHLVGHRVPFQRKPRSARSRTAARHSGWWRITPVKVIGPHDTEQRQAVGREQLVGGVEILAGIHPLRLDSPLLRARK